MCFDEYNIFIRQEVYTPSICKQRLLTDCTDTSHGSCYKHSYRIRATGKLRWYDTWTVTQTVLCDDQLHPHHKLHISHVSKQLPSMDANMCLAMTSKHCKWALSEHNYMDTQSVLHMMLYSMSKSVTSGCGIILMLMNMSIKNASVSTFGLVSSRSLFWDTVSYQWYYFLETILLGCLKMCQSVRQFYFSHTVGKMSSSGNNVMDVEGQLHGLLSCTTKSRDFFMMRHLKVHITLSLPGLSKI
jgi:hypothetical protein